MLWNVHNVMGFTCDHQEVDKQQRAGKLRVQLTTAIVADSLTTFLQKISGLQQQAALRLQLQLREAQKTILSSHLSGTRGAIWQKLRPFLLWTVDSRRGQSHFINCSAVKRAALVSCCSPQPEDKRVLMAKSVVLLVI